MIQFKEGDRNTKFIHSYVKGKRRKLRITEIKIVKSILLNELQEIGEEAVNAFSEQFRETSTDTNHSVIDCLPKIITDGHRSEMDKTLTVKKVKYVFFLTK